MMKLYNAIRTADRCRGWPSWTSGCVEPRRTHARLRGTASLEAGDMKSKRFTMGGKSRRHIMCLCWTQSWRQEALYRLMREEEKAHTYLVDERNGEEGKRPGQWRFVSAIYNKYKSENLMTWIDSLMWHVCMWTENKFAGTHEVS